MSNVKVATAYVHPVNAALDQYTEALIQQDEAQARVRNVKRELVRLAVEMGATDALTVNVARLRRIAS